MKLIEDPWVTVAIILSFLSTIWCIIYGIINWNEDVKEEIEEATMEEKWEKEEKEEVEKIL